MSIENATWKGELVSELSKEELVKFVAWIYGEWEGQKEVVREMREVLDKPRIHR